MSESLAVATNAKRIAKNIATVLVCEGPSAKWRSRFGLAREYAKLSENGKAKSLVLAGGTGYIGRAVAMELVAQGYSATALVRRETDRVAGADGVAIDYTSTASLTDALQSASPRAVISCIASVTGLPADAWAVDYEANKALLAAANPVGASGCQRVCAVVGHLRPETPPRISARQTGV